VTPPRVFVSRAAALSGPQQRIAGQWADALAGLGLEPVTLTRDEYAPTPWRQLRSLLGSCDGVVVLGFRTTEGPTPWNQLEAGLGIMGGLPVLVAPEEGVADGAFSPDVWGEDVSGVSLRVWERSEPLAEPALQDWLSAVRSGSRSRR
jgi:hypothetical protein